MNWFALQSSCFNKKMFSPVAGLPLVLCLMSVPAVAQERLKSFDIPAQDLSSALRAFGVSSDRQIMFSEDLTGGKLSNPVKGDYPAVIALQQILKGTGFEFEETESNVLLVKALQKESRGSSYSERKIESSKNKVIEEMIVTATKREQSLQDTVISISAIGSEAIERRSLVSMTDYMNSIPGVTLVDIGVGFNQIVIRGMGATGGEASTGTYLGEAPLSSVGVAANLDVKLVDMERVEVVRGPQGTLFGSGSMGGVVRNIPMSPNLEEFSGSVKAGYSFTGNNGSGNHELEAVVNIPLIKDQLALRTSAFSHDNSGFVEYVGASTPAPLALAEQYNLEVENAGDIGGSTYEGIRNILLWQPQESLEVSLTHFKQTLKNDGFPFDDYLAGEYQTTQYKVTNIDQRNDARLDKYEVANLTVDYDLDWANLISSSTSFKNTRGSFFGVSYFLNFLGFPMVQIQDDNESSGYMQEVRLSSELDGPYQFIVGVFYENTRRIYDSVAPWAADPALMPAWMGTDPNGLFTQHIEAHIEQLALFGELSYELNDDLTFTYGFRWFDYDRRKIDVNSGVFAAGRNEDESSQEKDTIHKFNVSYTPNEDVTLYAQWAQGFRLGQPQVAIPATLCDLDNDGILDNTSAPVDPGDINSDYVDSFELGTKTSFIDGRLAVNAAVYRSDWQGIPVGVIGIAGICGVTVNAGEALSQGAEIESTYYLTDSVQLTMSASYNNIELAESHQFLGEKGTRLPNAAKVNGSVGAEYEFNFAGYNAFTRAEFSYIGGFYTDIQAANLESGNYGKLNMRAGIDFNGVALELYGNNLTNNNSYKTANVTQGYRLRPRTIGVSVKYNF